MWSRTISFETRIAAPALREVWGRSGRHTKEPSQYTIHVRGWSRESRTAHLSSLSGPAGIGMICQPRRGREKRCCHGGGKEDRSRLSILTGNSARRRWAKDRLSSPGGGASGRGVWGKGRIDPQSRQDAYSARRRSMRSSSGGQPARLYRWRVGEGLQAPVIRRRPLRSTLLRGRRRGPSR